MEGLNRHPEIYPLRQWPGVHRASDAGLAGKGQHKIHPDIPLYNKQNCREWREIGRESLPSRIPIRGNKLYFTANSAAKAAAKAIRHQKQIVRGSILNFVYPARPMRFQILKRRSARRTLWRTGCGPQTIPGRFGHPSRSCGWRGRSALSPPRPSGRSRAS
jgi:hypothetical protein